MEMKETRTQNQKDKKQNLDDVYKNKQKAVDDMLKKSRKNGEFFKTK